ncbi:hypothetical protein KFE25_006130 [Diacronema lutheri]|uniref:Decapping nuclease n=1 Tax=Diacronema lutheri TaxID=2081491 RepID=A0A8J5Y1K8_DIALT|nr:hypothetical protein KFE25_006130 [Diacronema lutheri]
MLVAHRAVESEEELAAAVCSTYDEPREIACFSRLADRTVRYNDRSQLRAFVRPELETDLNRGFEAFVDKQGDASVDDIVAALADKKLDTSQAHFLTFRNNLNKLLGTPYNLRDEWRMGVSRHGRTVHLHILETEVQAARECARSEQERRMAFWGYAFEHAATASGKPRAASEDVFSEDVRIDCNQEFCSIAQSKLGGNRIILAGEVDCERRGFGEQGGGAHAMRKYIELKTSRLLSDAHARRSFERKMQKWFVQSFLLGLPSIVCGFRDDGGVLKKMQDFEVKQLPKLAQFRPHVMLNFGGAVLGWLYERVISGPPQGRYVFSYEPAQRRLALRIAPEGVVAQSEA